MCQTMVDAAAALECNKCAQMFKPTDFFEHVTGKNIDSTCRDDDDFTMCLDDDLSTIGPQQQMNTHQSPRIKFRPISSTRNKDVSRSITHGFQNMLAQKRQNLHSSSVCEPAPSRFGNRQKNSCSFSRQSIPQNVLGQRMNSVSHIVVDSHGNQYAANPLNLTSVVTPNNLLQSQCHPLTCSLSNGLGGLMQTQQDMNYNDD